MLNPRTQATVLLTVPFPGDHRPPSPLTPTEWGRFAEWLQKRGLKPEMLLSDQLHALLAELNDQEITRERIELLLGRGAALGLLMDKWSHAGIWVMTRADADYPQKLKRRLGTVSPAVLFGSGNRALLGKGGLAVVGSRHTSAEDILYSRQLGALAADKGYSIVSGGARGVDEAAMLGALEKEGTAIGVLANDLLQSSTSPKYRDHLARNNAILVSSNNPEARFDVGTAMQRNKYIYCLADAAIVVHSGNKGGTWSGARENLKKSWIPLWIKEASDPSAGNSLLLELPNAKRLPVELGQLSFDSLFEIKPANPGLTGNLSDNLANSNATNPYLIEPPPEDLPNFQTISFYELFLDKLHDRCLYTPCTVDELQTALDLHNTQLNIWLKRAVGEGRITRLLKPVRYQYVRQDP